MIITAMSTLAMVNLVSMEVVGEFVLCVTTGVMTAAFYEREREGETSATA